MRRFVIASVCVLSLVVEACTGNPAPQVTSPRSPSPVPRGGTLRVGMPSFPASPLTESTGLDPQKDYWYTSWELFRCCLLRTLLSYEGKPTAEGGSILRPDLAASMPEVSGDGLTWTFRIREGLRYAPPLQDLDITAQDFIRAIERTAYPGAAAGYPFYYSIIQGFDQFVAGDATTISGLEAPDHRTLRIHLIEPAGDLGERLSLAASAPIPPNRFDPTARLGVAEGHDNGYGPFLVSSGPYMLEGSKDLDFSLPPERQRGASGYVPQKSITLVRNPSWQPAQDRLRPALVDRIEITLGGSLEDVSARIDQGTLDLIVHAAPPPQAPLEQIEAYRSDPGKGTVQLGTRDFIRYISMNLGVAPFDDVHVRKAVNYAIDKAGLRETSGGPVTGEVIGHIALNSLERNLLLNYGPYATPGHRGDVSLAQQEMANSRYDQDRDGACDAEVCRNVRAVTFDMPARVTQARLVRRNLLAIGIHLDIEAIDPDVLFATVGDPRERVPISIGVAWGRDFLNASNYFVPLFLSEQIGQPGAANFSLVGASPEELETWGYKVREVPGVDERIDACLGLVGGAQVRCWVELDQYLMENVVPWVPIVSETQVVVVPSRIAAYSFDQFSSLPALDRIALRQPA